MKKIVKITAFLLALVMMTGVLAGCSKGDDSNTTTPTTAPSAPADTKTYTWDVTFVYSHFDVAEHGEVLPVLKFTNKNAADQILNIDPTAIAEEELITMLDDLNRLPMTAELKVTTAAPSAVDNLDAWTIDDGGSNPTYTFEVVTPLVEGDEATHGELIVYVKAKDYVWNIQFVYENGACGSYIFQNPGLQGDWDVKYGEQYVNQNIEVTPDNTTATLQIFNHQDWIVDNTREWYKWVVMDNDDECPYITYEIVKSLTMGDRNTPGEVVITISL